jgi:Zn-dependent protease
MATAYGRGQPDPRRHLDPFGAVAAALGGVGWARQPDTASRWPRRQARLVVRTLAAPLVCIGVGFGLFVADAAHGDAFTLSDLPHIADIVRGSLVGAPALLLAGTEVMGMGLLMLVPVPPMPGGRLLFALAPRTRGWQRAEYELVEHNWGLAALLLLLLPLFADPPVLILIDLVMHPLASLAGQLG